MKFDPHTLHFLAGATGTEIQRRGFPTALPLWSAQVLFARPELLTEIYRDYIRAGADIIVTNTFRTQRRTLQKVGKESETERINALAVDLALRARDAEAAGKHIFVAASMTSLEDCYRPDLVPADEVCRAEHTDQATILGVLPIDLFLLETFNTIREARIAAEAVVQTGAPFLVSFTADVDGNILNGDTWDDAVEQLAPLGPLAIVVNCVAPDIATKALMKLSSLARARGIAFGAYGNGGGHAGGDEGWDFSKEGSPVDRYVDCCKEWRALGATIIGGCCGTTPEYTARYSRIQ